MSVRSRPPERCLAPFVCLSDLISPRSNSRITMTSCPLPAARKLGVWPALSGLWLASPRPNNSSAIPSCPLLAASESSVWQPADIFRIMFCFYHLSLFKMLLFSERSYKKSPLLSFPIKSSYLSHQSAVYTEVRVYIIKILIGFKEKQKAAILASQLRSLILCLEFRALGLIDVNRYLDLSRDQKYQRYDCISYL